MITMTIDNVTRLAEVPAWTNQLLHELSCARSRCVTNIVHDSAPCELDDVLQTVQQHDHFPSDRHANLVHLHHACLPGLVTIGMIDRQDSRIKKLDHPAWDADLTRTIIRQESPHVDAIIRSVARPRGRVVLGILEDCSHSTTLEDVSSRIAEDPQGARIDLHHRILPCLEDAGLLEYAPSTRRIQYFGDPLVSDLLDGAAKIPPND